MHLLRYTRVDVQEDRDPVEHFHESVQKLRFVVGEEDDCDAHETLLSGSSYTATPSP